MTTTDNTPNYKNLPWLFARWPTETLTQWRESEIAARAVQVQQMASDNLVLYEAAKRAREVARAAFRAQYPRKEWPSALRRVVPYPPDLSGQWAKLLKRRAGRLSEIAQEAEDKKERFLQAMEEGHFRAMQERERVIRTRINAVARAHGLQLSERMLDKRFEELLTAIGLIEAPAPTPDTAEAS